MAKNQSKTADIPKAASHKDASGEVQKKAYELYVKRGKRSGHAIDDWLEAERLVKHKARF